MAIFLDTTGEPTLGVGICDRCSRKMPIGNLMSDPNSPGLKVCLDDCDEYDPYRLPAPQPERLTLEFYRPDLPLNVASIIQTVDIRITEDENQRITQDDDIRILEE
jgi:hypothetical protein